MQKVLPGQPVKIRASTWNGFIDAANYVQNQQRGIGGVPGKTANDFGTVLVRNDAGVVMNQFCAVALTNLLVTPYNNEADFRNRVPVFSGTAFTESSNNFAQLAIATEPILPGGIGKATVLGVTPAPVRIDDLTHLFVTADTARPGVLKSAGSGYCRIIWRYPVTGDQWALLLMGGGDGGGTGESYHGFFKLMDASDESGRKVAVIDGSGSGYAGVARINNYEFSLPAVTLPLAVGVNMVYLVSEYDTADKKPKVPEIKIFSSLQSYSENKAQILLGQVFLDGASGTVRIFQQHYGEVQGFIWGSCRS